MKHYLILLIFLTGCSTVSYRKKFQQPENAVSIMAYNVENLFDNIKDKDREDHTYLPLSKKNTKEHKAVCNQMRSPRYRQSCLELDWSDNAVEKKLERVADVIQQVNNGDGPDVLILVEVENKNILKQLRDSHLQKSNYQTLVLIEGPDKRGIDIAILSRLPVAKQSKLHKIPFKANTKDDQIWMNRSRGILHTGLKLPSGETLNVFGVHFPSPRNPSYWRAQAINFLNQLLEEVPSNEYSVAAGDFNISKDDERRNKFYSKKLSSHWLVSHKIGCNECKGTNYYHGTRSWSFLDALLFSKNFAKKAETSTWHVESSSIQIPNYSIFQISRYLNPARFEENSPVGVSDHWPLYARILYKPKKETAPNTNGN